MIFEVDGDDTIADVTEGMVSGIDIGIEELDENVFVKLDAVVVDDRDVDGGETRVRRDSDGFGRGGGAVGEVEGAGGEALMIIRRGVIRAGLEGDLRIAEVAEIATEGVVSGFAEIRVIIEGILEGDVIIGRAWGRRRMKDGDVGDTGEADVGIKIFGGDDDGAFDVDDVSADEAR